MDNNKPFVFQRIIKNLIFFIVILVLIAVLPMQPIFAYSYDKNYLDYSSWDESNINTVAIDCEGAMGELSGSLNYFTEESSAYFLFNLNESEITENSVISVIFSVSSTQGSYDFTVDNSGVSYNEEAAEKYFDTESKADEFTTGHAIVTVIMDIKDKVTTHDFAVKIAVDGRLYNLFDSKPLTIETYLPANLLRKRQRRSLRQRKNQQNHQNRPLRNQAQKVRHLNPAERNRQLKIMSHSRMKIRLIFRAII